MTSSSTTLLMSLPDVAALAQVQRPVVSVWRSRPGRAGETDPFPSAVRVADGLELFDSDDVVSWLERTRRGNNVEPRADLAAHVRLPSVSGAQVTPVDAAEALLCLLVGSEAGVSGQSADDLLDLAEELDPDDDFLYREVEAAGDEAPAVAAYVQRLVNAAFGADGALAVLDGRRARTRVAAQLELTARAQDLMGEMAAALALDLTTDTVTLDDATGGGADLVDPTVSALDERVDVDVIVRGDTPRSRAGRRRQIIQRRRLMIEGGSASLLLARFPNLDRPSMTPGQILDSVDELQLRLTETDRALVVGPAAVLCDTLADPRDEAVRDNVLRMGRLRCAVRLPNGLLSGSPRSALGIWVLGPEAQSVPLGQRRTMTADLTDVPLDATVVSDLATDVIASLESREIFHRFRFARAARTAELLAGRGRLVEAGVRGPRRTAVASEEVIALRRLVGMSGLEGRVRIEPSATAGSSPVTVADVLRSGQAQLVAGTRMTSEPLPTGSLHVIGASTLVEDVESMTVDALEFTRRHPRARRTEPGDVVFVTSPRPHAFVDEAGLSVVAYPARVLRFAPTSGVVPQAAARAINAQPVDAHGWRGWSLPRVREGQMSQVAGVLRRIDDETRVLRQRLSALQQLGDRVGIAVGDGTAVVSLKSAEGHEKDETMHSRERGAS